jgi:hypothetical protein
LAQKFGHLVFFCSSLWFSILWGGRRASLYAPDDDYFFASETMKGKQLYTASCQGKCHQQEHRLAYVPAFLRTLVKANGEDVKTVQEFLRHANSRITLDVYAQAVNSNKRAAQSKVVKMMVPKLGEMKDENTLKMGGRTLIAPISNPDFDVTLGPYVP